MNLPQRFKLNESPRKLLQDYAFIIVGALVQALSVVMFLAPADLAPGGVSGLAFIFSRFSRTLPLHLSIGLLTFLLNVPLLLLGVRHLGGWRFLSRTIFTVVLYTAFTAFLETRGSWKVTDDVILNTLFGAVVGGVGAGLVFRTRATTGGTDVLALLLVRWRGVPLGQSYLFTDIVVIALAGLSFGWDKALYALIAVYITGVAAETMAEGVNVSRTALIISNQHQTVCDAVLTQLGRGLTWWKATGGYTGNERPILFVVISRAETALLKAIVAQADPQAFVVIGQAQEVYGEGFRRFD
jgi:uncharacterized membrane-anchored protein YitT (DUF2179 family)